mgnify:CR=1 FL=1
MNYKQNEKINQVKESTLVVGIDIGSTTQYARAFDWRGIELGKVFTFSNSREGFEAFKAWMQHLQDKYRKSDVIVGIEPTGHYWFCLATWMISNGISVVQVNSYAVKQTKEIEDNSQLKDDTKDPKLIANLVKDGNFAMPYLPEKLYGELRRLSMFKDQLNEDRIRSINRMHREMKIYYPEYKDALGKSMVHSAWNC